MGLEARRHEAIIYLLILILFSQMGCMSVAEKDSEKERGDGWEGESSLS